MTILASIDTLETPAAVVDLDRMDANLRKSAEYCRAHGLAWRPHVKTHKTPALASTQLHAGADGITVATLREAEVMAPAANDLLLAYPPVGAPKLERLTDLLRSGVRLTVGLDSLQALQGVSGAASDARVAAGVLIELDLGMGRVGVGTPEEAVALARHAVESDGVGYRGVMFYPGHVRRVEGDQDPALTALSDRLRVFLEALGKAGLEAEVVSGGSTPTFWYSHRIEGLTEVRPGTNIFNDRTTAAIGACEWDECAYSVLATVVSTAVRGQAVVDAGSKALAKEELRGDGTGFGALLDDPKVVVRALSEEHGILDLSRTDWQPQVGDLVRIVPNHVCASVNLQDRLLGARGGEIVDAWDVAGRGRGRG